MTGLITDPQPEARLEILWAHRKKSALSTLPLQYHRKSLGEVSPEHQQIQGIPFANKAKIFC